MAVRKEADDLASALQAAIEGLGASGALAQAFSRANLQWQPA